MKFKYIFYPIVYPIYWACVAIGDVCLAVACGCGSFADWINDSILEY